MFLIKPFHLLLSCFLYFDLSKNNCSDASCQYYNGVEKWWSKCCCYCSKSRWSENWTFCFPGPSVATKTSLFGQPSGCTRPQERRSTRPRPRACMTSSAWAQGGSLGTTSPSGFTLWWPRPSRESRSTRTLSPGLATNWIFFCFLFVKNHWFTWRANQWPLIKETLFSSVPPSNSLVSVLDPWLDLGAASGTTEIHGHRQVWHTRRIGPRTP